MVLSRARGLLIVIAGLAGCNQSLFDAFGSRGDGGTGGDDGGPDSMPAPERCEDPCIADATRDFPDTSNTVWSYLDDRRNRIWIPMFPSGEAIASLNLNNRFERCSNPAVPVCQALPDALLVSSDGMMSPADPAIEFRSADRQVIQLVFHVHVPIGSPAHRVRLYRNSREDILITDLVTPAATVRRTITVDALPDDRFLISLEPDASPGGPVALRFFVRGPVDTPSTCLLAVPFTPGAAQYTIANLCGDALVSMRGTIADNPILGDYPLTRHNSEIKVGSFEGPYYFTGIQKLARGSAMTVQFWAQYESSAGPHVWLFSDVDETKGGGLGIEISDSGATIEATTHTGTMAMSQATTYQAPLSWHFIRVVHADNVVDICVDGSHERSGPLPGPTASDRAPLLGKDPANVNYLTGSMDDVRVFSEALHCK